MQTETPKVVARWTTLNAVANALFDGESAATVKADLLAAGADEEKATHLIEVRQKKPGATR
jgi:hypothetical protein